ncbi:MAG: hypothetical protein EA383_15595 [Spirochaetaceae bacterium]|nr:MAG: hypothetical protein EA383_15535 [Spirochaetaceae bacterium]TVQ22383.1 MAG: hypothetical protein EA383_15595 [Spirochaetaceae bacterium]
MTIHNRRISTLILLSVVAVTLGITAVVTTTYIQVNTELRRQTVSTVENHLRAQQQLLVQQLRTIADSKTFLLRSLATTPSMEPDDIQRMQRRFSWESEAAQSSAVFFRGREPVIAPAHLVSDLQGLYAPFSPERPRSQLPFSIQDFREAGGWYVGNAFRSASELRSIVPIAVSDFQGIQGSTSAIVAVDITHILYSIMTNFVLKFDGRNWPLDVALYDRNGMLLATTLNNLRQRHLILDSSTAARVSWDPDFPRVPSVDPRSLVIYRENRITEIVYDADTGFFLAGSIAEPAITRRVNVLSSQIVMIGVLNIAAILVLGLLLLRSIRKLSAAQEKRVEMYNRSTQAVLGPHFLFNSLDTIVGLASQGEKSTLMRGLMALTIQLEGAMRNVASEVTVVQEMEYVSSYLELQGFRFHGRFEIELSIEPELRYELIPRFCIQPLVENCFTHAIPDSPDPVDIALYIQALDETTIAVVVSDSGPGINEERRLSVLDSLNDPDIDWSDGIGLAAIHSRLVESYGRKYGIRILNPGDNPIPNSGYTPKTGFNIAVLLPRLGRVSKDE